MSSIVNTSFAIVLCLIARKTEQQRCRKQLCMTSTYTVVEKLFIHNSRNFKLENYMYTVYNQNCHIFLVSHQHFAMNNVPIELK